MPVLYLRLGQCTALTQMKHHSDQCQLIFKVQCFSEKVQDNIQGWKVIPKPLRLIFSHTVWDKSQVIWPTWQLTNADIKEVSHDLFFKVGKALSKGLEILPANFYTKLCNYFILPRTTCLSFFPPSVPSVSLTPRISAWTSPLILLHYPPPSDNLWIFNPHLAWLFCRYMCWHHNSYFRFALKCTWRTGRARTGG